MALLLFIIVSLLCAFKALYRGCLLENTQTIMSVYDYGIRRQLKTTPRILVFV